MIIKDLHSKYVSYMKQRLGDKFRATTPLRPAAIEVLYGWLNVLRPGSILELGAGMSSLVFRDWINGNPNSTLVTADHDPLWLSTVTDVTQKLLPPEYQKRATFASLAGAKAAVGTFDLTFVDQGPTAATRFNDVKAWVYGKSDTLIFDDIVTNSRGVKSCFAYTTALVDFLSTKSVIIVISPESKSDGLERALGLVVKRGTKNAALVAKL
jgi:predicted O-methyltransferase YrrM